MQIGGGVAEAARKAAEEAARRAAEAARKAAEAARAKAAQAAQQAKQHQEQAKKAEAPKDVKETKSHNMRDAADNLAPAQVEGKDTCAAAAHQLALKEKHPHLHDRLVKDLAEKGEATMPNGQKLCLSQKNAEFIDKQNATPAEKNDMRMQAAMMDYADPQGEYDLEADVNRSATNPFDKPGLTPDQAARLDNLDATSETHTAQGTQTESTAKRAFEVVTSMFGGHADSAQECMADVIEGNLKEDQEAGRESHLQLDLGDGAHQMIVKDVDDVHNTVTLADTNGTQTLTNAEVAAAVEAAQGENVGTYTNTATTTAGGSVRRIPPPPPPPVTYP